MKRTGINPLVLREICDLAKKHHVKKVVLFGSRARGEHHRASDIDLAVWGGDILNFSLDVDENTSTLLTYDIIDMGKELNDSFLESIREEGCVLYEEI